MATTTHHKVVIVGGGSAGISVASRLTKEVDDMAVIDPSDKHYYQPLWTLVGGGCAKREITERSEASVMAKGVNWIKDAVTTFDQSAPDWVKSSPLATDAPSGYVDVDKHTHKHVRYPNIFSRGDAGSTPNSKTGAAIRKQALVVAANVLTQLAGGDPNEKYDGYASCPLTTSRHKMLLAEFDYTMEPAPTFPKFINAQKPRRDMWILKNYGLPFMYWNLMLKGRA